MKQAYNTACRATDDPHAIREILEAAASHVSSLDFNKTPADNSNFLYKKTNELTGCDDPYKDDKRKWNDRCLELLPGLENRVEASDDPIKTALRIAIAGNSIDMGIGYGFDIERVLEAALDATLAVDDYPQLKERLAGGGLNVLYLGDNAGEIVLDRPLIERLAREHDVTLVVKGGPIINDATREDAEYVGLTDIVNVIDTGSNGIGIKWDDVSDEFRTAYERADIIISKGQGNYETMCHLDREIYFLLMAKCETVAAMLGVNFRDVVCRRSQAGK